MDQPKSSKEILYRLEYHEVLGDVVATLLMSQIHYWYSPAKNGASKLRVYREGKWWIAKAVSDWGRECGLSDMQVRRGLKLLQQVGLVEIDTFMLGRNPVTHLRFLAIQGRGPINDVPDLSLILVKSGGPFVTGNTPLVTDNNPLVTCNTYPVTGNESITVDYTETTQKLLQGVSDATEVQSLTYEPGEVMAVPLSTKGKAHDSSKTILANLKGVTKVADDYQVSPAGLYLLWVNTVPEFHENVGCQKKWTLKQSANMKRLIELWGPDVTREILAYVVEKWIAYTKYCETNAGAFKTPLQPTVEFLFRYGAEAKNFWVARPQSKEVHIADTPPKKLVMFKAKQAVQVTAPSVPDPVPEEDKEMTMEELLAWKAEQSGL